ncbi:carcinoembryonic antigen-related cell adhesion molecule 1-like [Lepisosteus oculatus]|uniref:carcinoembryonic antigen-related cell adhesion molecule 1-like n=1 Tax=Lepisosteus oculatus TaxID=7918 RepID=UPI003722A0D8
METRYLALLCLLAATGSYAQKVLVPNKRVTGVVGGSVVLKVSVEPPETQKAAISWAFNSGSGLQDVIGFADEINEGDEYQGRVSLNISTGSLELRQLTLNDTGSYDITIVTKKGMTLPAEIELKVYEAISDVSVKPTTGMQPIMNENLTLVCNVKGPVDFRQWQKNSSPLIPTVNVTFSRDNSTVSFFPLQLSDQGIYECTAFNIASNRTAAYKLLPSYGPEKAVITGPDAVNATSSLKLTCFAVSVPECTYTWHFNGLEVYRGSEYIISRASSAHGGNYTCVAHNGVTMKSASVVKQLTVTGVHVEKSDSLNNGQIAGIVIASVIGAGLVTAALCFVLKKKGTNGTY